MHSVGCVVNASAPSKSGQVLHEYVTRLVELEMGEVPELWHSVQECEVPVLAVVESCDVSPIGGQEEEEGIA